MNHRSNALPLFLDFPIKMHDFALSGADHGHPCDGTVVGGSGQCGSLQRFLILFCYFFVFSPLKVLYMPGVEHTRPDSRRVESIESS